MSRLGRLLHAVFLGLLGAVIVHITALFLLPHYLESESHWQRLTVQAAPYQFVAPTADDPIMTMLDPNFSVRFCHFDLSQGPVALSASGHVPFWSLSLYAQDGSNLYSLNSRTAGTNNLDLVIGDAIGMMNYRQSVSDEERQQILSAHDIEEGFVILRVLIPSNDWQLVADAFLRSATCRQLDD